MADEATVDHPKPVEESTSVVKPLEESTRPVDVADPTTDAKSADGAAASADAPAEEQAPKTAAAVDDQIAKDEPVDAPLESTSVANGDAAPALESTTTNGTPTSAKKANNGRRKSASGTVPEHKSKKTPNKKKKVAPELHLDTQPGDMWMVAMRGYQPWPVIICDEEMLPESLLSKRPVSAKRLDGTYREDFEEGGKNAKDRKYPIMFLGTNEFAWQANTDLLLFNEEEVKKDVEANVQGKRNKQLWSAYQVAAEGHDLAHFKEVLAGHEQAMQDDAIKQAEKAAKKSDKASKRKSTAGDASEDVDMEDADEDAAPSAKKAKATKKRKKEEDSDGEPDKPAKTPKTKLKLTNKPKDASAAKPKKEPKSKKAKASEDEAEAAPAEEPPMTEEERLQKRGKSVLYLRHRLQKGFLARDQAPKEDEMANMSGYLKQLEELEDLEAEVIKETKVHKVLKAILKLDTIPKDEEFHFKTRSNSLLGKWSGTLAAEPEPSGDAPASAAAPTTNGVNHDKETATEETPVAAEVPKDVDGDGDVAMTESKDEAPAVSAPADADAEPDSEATPAAVETATT